jgi:hypothetical protein
MLGFYVNLNTHLPLPLVFLGPHSPPSTSIIFPQIDQDKMLATADGADIYTTFNLLIRRQAKENNFKAVLETMRDLMNTECVLFDCFLR